MMILKYRLKIQELQDVVMPNGADILTVQEQNCELTIWARCDETAPKVYRTIYIYATGQPMLDDLNIYHGTVQMQDGLVWHVFEGKK